jgi:hypothetical protein
MRFRNLLAFAVVLSPLLAGCGNDQLPAGMVGGFVRDVTYPDGNHRLHLDITPTGMTVTGGSTQTLPLGANATGGSVKIGASGSALFKTMKCFNDFSCRFATENGCEGTFTRDSSGSVVLVGTGDCETWSGKWLSDKDAPPAAATPSAVASGEPAVTGSAGAAAPAHTGIPGASATATATASPSGTASAGPSASGAATGLPTSLPTSIPTSLPTANPKMDCLSACNATNIACVRECKVGDLDCMKACSNTMVGCAQKCP